MKKTVPCIKRPGGGGMSGSSILKEYISIFSIPQIFRKYFMWFVHKKVVLTNDII